MCDKNNDQAVNCQCQCGQSGPEAKYDQNRRCHFADINTVGKCCRQTVISHQRFDVADPVNDLGNPVQKHKDTGTKPDNQQAQIHILFHFHHF